MSDLSRHRPRRGPPAPLTFHHGRVYFCISMKPERWERVKKVLDAALEVPPGDRTAFLDKTCGSDPELRKEVESLVVASEDSDSFLEKSPVAFIQDGLSRHEKLRLPAAP